MELDMSLTESLVVTDALSAAIQELDMIMGTEKTQLIGMPYFGLNMEQFLWDLQPSTEQIKRHIDDNISKYTFWLRQFTHDISVEAVPGSEHAIYTVSISLRGIGEENDSDAPVLASKDYTYR